MKKILMILMLLISVVAGAMAQNDAIYVYRNDGEFNAFLKSDVDSMRYSHLDADSVFHDDWQMQEFFTADSIYRIPLAAIDSVSFVTPSMEYKSDVKLVEDNLLKYLIAHTDKTLTFSLNVPTGLLPSVGDVVVFDKYEEPIPEGFYGRYVSRKSTSDGIECLFEEVGLEEIYNHLVVVGQVGSYNEDDNENSQRRIFTVGNNKRVCLPLKVPLSVSIKDIVHGVDIFGSNAKRAVDINGSIGITLDRPQLTINYIICIGERNLKNQVMLKARFYSEGEASVSGNLAGNYSPEPMWFPGCQWPFNFYGIAGEFDLGLYFEANGEINASYSVPIVIDVTRGFSIKEGEWPYFYEGNGSCANRDKAEWDLNLNGSLSAGLAGRLSVGLVNKKVASLDVTLKAGPEVSANFKIADKESGFNSNLYDALKNTEVTASLRLQADAGYRIWFKDRESFDHPLNVHLFKTTRPILPTIENVKWTPSGLSSGKLTADVSRDTFTPVSLGWTLRDKNDEVYKKEFYNDNYQFNANWPYVNLPLTLSDLPAYYYYKAYPTIKLWKWEIPINEYAEVVSEECPVHIADFSVTNSYYQQGAFSNDGLVYDYKYEAATTAEIESLEDVIDWGYVYKDPYGKEKHISLMQYGTSFTDTHFAYYRNEPYSSACLYGYVKYKGDNEYIYDEPYDYPLVHTDFEATIEELWSNYEIYEHDSNGEGYVQYSLSALTNARSLDDAEDWGIYLYDDKSNEYKLFSYKDNAYEMQEGCVYFEWDVPEDSYEEFDDVNFYAVKGIKMGVYKKLLPTADMINPVYIFGAPLVFEFSYDQKPSVTFDNNEGITKSWTNGVQYYVEYEGISYFIATGTLWMKDFKIKQTLADGYTYYTSDALDALDFGDSRIWWYKYYGGYYTNSLDAYNTFEAEVYLKNGSTIKGTNYVIWNFDETQLIDYGGNRTRQRIRNANSSTTNVLRMEDIECDLPIKGSIHCKRKEDRPAGDASARKMIPLSGQVW